MQEHLLAVKRDDVVMRAYGHQGLPWTANPLVLRQDAELPAPALQQTMLLAPVCDEICYRYLSIHLELAYAPKTGPSSINEIISE